MTKRRIFLQALAGLFIRTPAQAELYWYMGELSEECFFAGWHMGLEHALWPVVSGPCRVGREYLDHEVSQLLQRKYEAACGWFVWGPDDDLPRFVSRTEWLKQLSAMHLYFLGQRNGLFTRHELSGKVPFLDEVPEHGLDMPGTFALEDVKRETDVYLVGLSPYKSVTINLRKWE